MAKPKIDAKKMGGAAAKKLGGGDAVKDAKGAVKDVKGAVKDTGIPTKKPKIESPEQLKKKAKAKAQKRLKALMKVGIALAIVALIALGYYLIAIHGRQPKDALATAFDYAYAGNTIKFRQMFTTDSIQLVDNGDENLTEPWEKLIESITPVGKRPEVLKQTIEESETSKIAEVKVKIEDNDRSIFLREEEGKWKITLNVAINPKHIELPDDIPADYIDNFSLNDDMEAWWEVPAEAKAADEGFFSKLKNLF